MSTPHAAAPPFMEQITPRLRRIGRLYELDGEDFRRVVGQPRLDRDGLDVAWDLREFALMAGAVLPDDNLPDEPVRRTVGQARPR